MFTVQLRTRCGCTREVKWSSSRIPKSISVAMSRSTAFGYSTREFVFQYPDSEDGRKLIYLEKLQEEPS